MVKTHISETGHASVMKRKCLSTKLGPLEQSYCTFMLPQTLHKFTIILWAPP